ncbi:Serpin-Z1C [Nosema granulosis]|uniref:Serpin-Z1C n=1 Tax=Nosema granulosis TaxID=83296 RepID=A0A9P6GZS8_9MICR|nr:Serpin-Z1C [Nosema granulosis]
MKMVNSLLTLTFILCSDNNGLESGIVWVKRYLKNEQANKGEAYDYEVTKDFLSNIEETTIFSPISSEINVYLQACTGEYSEIYKESAKKYIKKLVETLCDDEGISEEAHEYIRRIAIEVFNCSEKYSKTLISQSKEYIKNVNETLKKELEVEFAYSQQALLGLENVLKCGSEYENGVMKRFTEYYDELVKLLNKQINKGKYCTKKDETLVCSNSIYIPGNSNESFFQLSPAYNFIKYDPHTVLRKSEDDKNLLDLDKNYLKRSSRFYISKLHFKDTWLKQFTTEQENVFYRRDGSSCNRLFMNGVDDFLYELVEKNGLKFEVIAIPYTTTFNGDEIKRYSIYLIPDDKKTDLSLLWEQYHAYTKFNIKEHIESLLTRRICLQIPKLGDLKSKLDLKKILKNTYTYGKGPSTKVLSTVEVVNTDPKKECLDTEKEKFSNENIKFVKANRPYCVFIYDLPTKRTLFVINDIGT